MRNLIIGLLIGIGVSSAAADFSVRDGVGFFRTIKSISLYGGAEKYSVHLDDEEIAHIKEACR